MVFEMDRGKKGLVKSKCVSDKYLPAKFYKQRFIFRSSLSLSPVQLYLPTSTGYIGAEHTSF